MRYSAAQKTACASEDIKGHTSYRSTPEGIWWIYDDQEAREQMPLLDLRVLFPCGHPNIEENIQGRVCLGSQGTEWLKDP